MSSQIQFGIFDHIEARGEQPVGELYEERIELLKRAEEGGFYGYHLAEHHGHGLSTAPSQLVFLAALARETTRLKLIPTVVCLPLHHPVRLFEELVMVDALSHGRLELGVGKGITPFEHLFFGHHPDEGPARAAEILEMLLRGWETGVLSSEGSTFYEFLELSLPFKPVQRHHPPLWSAGNVESAGRLGHNFILPIPVTEDVRSRYDELRAESRRHPGHHNRHIDEPWVAQSQAVVIGRSSEEAEQLGRRAWAQMTRYMSRIHGLVPPHLQGEELPEPDNPISKLWSSLDPLESEMLVTGTADRIRDYYVEAAQRGTANYFIISIPYGDMTHAEALETLDLFISEVIPAVREVEASAMSVGPRASPDPVVNVEFYASQQGAYQYVPAIDQVEQYSRSTYVSLPTDFYDDARGMRRLDEFLDSLVIAEKLGFDGLFFTEQHNGPIGLAPNALTLASHIAARTSQIRICAVGPIMAAYLSPVRLAEEIALVDMLSRGRLIVGLPLGIGGQYHSYGMMSPATARERYYEANELLIRAMRDPGPFEFQGKYFHVPYVNLWPRPLQKPHPEIWVPAAGSRETLEFVAKNRYVYQITSYQEQNIELFREACAAEGYEPDDRQFVLFSSIHVAESDEQAWREVAAHRAWASQNWFRSTFPDAFPPGHVSPGSLRKLAADGYRTEVIKGGDDRGEAGMRRGGAAAASGPLVGSPDTIAERLTHQVVDRGLSRVILNFDQCSQPLWMTLKSMTLFAEQVMPRFRDSGKPVWARSDARYPGNVAEWSAIAEPPKATPQAILDDVGVVDVLTAHVDELRTPAR